MEMFGKSSHGCMKYEDLLARFIHGDLLLQEKEELECHLAVCASCETLYADVTRIDRVLRDAPGKLVDPPPYLRAKILANLPDAEPVPFARRWARWGAAIGAVAACAVTALVLFRAEAPRETRVAAVAPPEAAPTVQAPAPQTAVPATAPTPSAAPKSAAPAPAVRVQVIREVRIYFYYPPAQKVAVTGDFNGWDRDGVPLTRAGKPGLWTAELKLKPGAYSYNFIVDGDVLVPDPNAPNQMPDGYGGTNSILLVKGGDQA